MSDISVKILTAFGFPRQSFIKVLRIKFHGNPSRGNVADMGGQLIGAFRDLAKVPKHAEILGSKYLQTDGSLDLIFPCYSLDSCQFTNHKC